MKDRYDNFNRLCDHPWYFKFSERLKIKEREFCYRFIEENKSLNKDDFSLKVNRLFVDDKERPKNYKIILELLLASNT